MAKSQSGGLGPRGFEALFGDSASTYSQNTSSANTAAKPAEEPAATERVTVDTEAALSAEDIAAIQAEADRAARATAERVAQEEAARAAAVAAAQASGIAAGAAQGEFEPHVTGDILTESIDVRFSMSEPEITERAPRPATRPKPEPVAAPAPVKEVPLTKLPDGSIAEIALELIDVNPFQPRLRFRQEPLDELAASIARDGLLQPITVRSLSGGRFQIISGERRFRASQLAGLRSIPAYVRDAADREMGQFALIENLQREDLNPIEAAVGYRNLMKSQNLTQSEVAQLLSKGRSTIANTLRLLDLPEDLQEMIYNEQITEGHARAIQAIPSEEGRKKLAERVVAEGLSVRATENLARLMTGRPATDASERQERATVPAAYKAVARSLKQQLGTNVKIKNAGGKNKLEIEFADAADLERICAQFLGGVKVAAEEPAAKNAKSSENDAETTAENTEA